MFKYLSFSSEPKVSPTIGILRIIVIWTIWQLAAMYLKGSLYNFSGIPSKIVTVLMLAFVSITIVKIIRWTWDVHDENLKSSTPSEQKNADHGISDKNTRAFYGLAGISALFLVPVPVVFVLVALSSSDMTTGEKFLMVSAIAVLAWALAWFADFLTKK